MDRGIAIMKPNKKSLNFNGYLEKFYYTPKLADSDVDWNQAYEEYMRFTQRKDLEQICDDKYIGGKFDSLSPASKLKESPFHDIIQTGIPGLEVYKNKEVF